MKRLIADNLKNLRGWQTSRRLVAFAVDDYANVRVSSKAASERMTKAGLDMSSQMDRYDSLETREDLEALFEVLGSVRDGHGRPAIFTAYALSTNPDFEKIRTAGDQYYAESVDSTFARLATEQAAAYDGAWWLWKEGIAKGLIWPQFHGREHLNLDLFEYKLKSGARDLRENLENDSMAALNDETAMPGVSFSHAFGLHRHSELNRHREIIRDGLNRFEKIWGFRSTTFTPPALKLHPSLGDYVTQYGIRAVHKPIFCRRPLGDGASRKEINRSGSMRGRNHLTIVRNVVFEPCKPMGFEPVSRAIAQVDAAFNWNKPAIISSHRANYCGHLDEENRQNGLSALKELLGELTRRWPDLEFVTTNQLINEYDSGMF